MYFCALLKLRRVLLTVRHQDSQSCNTSSILVHATQGMLKGIPFFCAKKFEGFSCFWY